MEVWAVVLDWDKHDADVTLFEDKDTAVWTLADIVSDEGISYDDDPVSVLREIGKTVSGRNRVEVTVPGRGYFFAQKSKVYE